MPYILLPNSEGCKCLTTFSTLVTRLFCGERRLIGPNQRIRRTMQDCQSPEVRNIDIQLMPGYIFPPALDVDVHDGYRRKLTGRILTCHITFLSSATPSKASRK